MSSPPPNQFYRAVNILKRKDISLSNLIRHSLIESEISSSNFVAQFLEDLPQLLGWMAHHEGTCDIVQRWMKEEYTSTLMLQIRDVLKAEHGFHFVAGSITAEKMKQCTIKKIAEGIQTHAPDVWHLVGRLLQSDSALVHRREKEREEREKERRENGTRKWRKKSDAREEDGNENQISDLFDEDHDEPEDIEEQLENQRLSLLQIVSKSFVENTGTQCFS